MKQILKAYSLTIGFFLFFITAQSQVWEYSISPDYVLSVRDKWGDLEEYEAKFIVRNQKIAFVKTIEVSDDKWGKLKFPEDFELSRGEFDSTQIYEFDWIVEVKKENIVNTKILFDASPNEFFQLTNIDVYPLINAKKIDVWGKVIDAYTWTDIKGKNIVIRSKTDTKNGKKTTKYIYLYHYLKIDNQYLLLRKITDSNKGCLYDNVTKHIIESIELTDVDRDSIGEISFMYTVDCVSDLSPFTLKLMMLTEGKKFAIRGETLAIFCDENDNEVLMGGNYTVGKELEMYTVYKRFLVNKWVKYIEDK